jgi:hypothetical protein
MRGKRVLGECHICGGQGTLSYEHVPPRSAFNNRPAVLKEIDWMRKGGPVIRPGGQVQQRGAGGYTLCPRCNERTGKWYGEAYAEWAKEGLEAIHRCGWGTYVRHRFEIYPLRVLKQIVCMFFSANGPGFTKRHPDLVDFVLSRNRKYMQTDVRIYAFYTMSGLLRQAGVQSLIRLQQGVYAFSEITFPPFGYVMFLRCGPHDPRLYDISFFDRYAFSKKRSISLVLPGLPVVTLYPGDYRTPEQLQRTIEENLALEREEKMRSRGSGG